MDLDSHLVLMTMMVQDQLLLHTLARILTIELEPLVFTAITTIQCTLYSKVTDHGKTLTMDLDYEKGSYTTDPTKDGSVDCTSVSQVETRTCTISGNGTTFTDDEGNKYTRK